MIIVWKWSEDPNSGVIDQQWDQWETETGDLLLRMDIQKKEDWPLISNVASEHQGKEMLVFLHNSSPNFLDETAKDAVSRELGQKKIAFRAVLFSGGSEPIYGAHSDLGILGLDGFFAARLSDDKTRMVYCPVLDDSQRLIKQTHFDFVRDFYYFGRRKRILELGEDFRIASFGYSLQDKPLPDFLKSKEELWKKLLAFCGKDNAAELPREFDMRPYLVYLKTHGKEEAADILAQKQQHIAGLLESEPVEGVNAVDILDEIYLSFTGLFSALPQDTI